MADEGWTNESCLVIRSFLVVEIVSLDVIDDLLQDTGRSELDILDTDTCWIEFLADDMDFYYFILILLYKLSTIY